jgi:hypothetical protein
MMKLKLNKSKTILIAFAAFLLVFATVFTTVAYLTDTDDVHNTLTVGKVKIKLEENASQGAELKILPGAAIAYNPTVTVEAGSANCYVFVKVEPTEKLKTVFTDMINTNNWKALDGVANVYYYSTIVAKSASDTPLASIVTNNQLTVSGNWNGDTIDLDQIKITAYAIQSEYIKGADTATPADAWALIAHEYPDS